MNISLENPSAILVLHLLNNLNRINWRIDNISICVTYSLNICLQRKHLRKDTGELEVSLTTNNTSFLK